MFSILHDQAGEARQIAGIIFPMDELGKMVRTLAGVELSNRQLDLFAMYEKVLLEWNEKFNLTAIRDVEGVRSKHFLDSLTCLPLLQSLPCRRLVDVGTGAGFPGVPLKIALPQIQLTLVESVGKKADFCRLLVQTLGLEGVQVVTGRAEELGLDKSHRERYDWAVGRAVAVMPVLAEYLLPLVRVGGGMLAQKGESAPAETQTAENAMRVLGGKLRLLKKVNLPGVVEDRYLVVVDKVSGTPPGYPRRVGLAVKKPIL
jgi:16S rRNA (guanine527-N7)-methyltransferase